MSYPFLKDPKAKRLATLVLMIEFDYIIREAREIFDFYGMNREKPVIDEILYNSDYALRHLLGENQIFDDNLMQNFCFRAREHYGKRTYTRFF